MEVVPIKFYRGINSYWKRRRYQQLDPRSSSSYSSPSGKRSRKAAARFGSGGRRGGSGGWFLRLRRRLSFRIKFGIPSPGKLFARIRDAYVDCMLAMAGKTPALTAAAGPQIWSRRVPKGRPEKVSSSAVERRLMFEIYNSLVLAGEI